MELNLLKFLLRKWVLLCQKVYSKKDRWSQVCFHKFYSLSALKMKLFKGTKMDIHKAFSWDKCQHTTFKKSFSIKVTSNSLKCVKKPRKINQFKTPPVTFKASKTNHQLDNMMPTMEVRSSNSKTASRWTASNTFSTNASKPNSRKNMKKESNFWITELKKDRRSKDLTRMHIWYWCRIILGISIMLRIWREGSLDRRVKWIISRLRMGFRCHHSTRKIPYDQPFLKAKTVEKTSTPPPKTTKPTANSTTRKTKSHQVKEESNIINSILIQHKEPLKWCVSNINQLV